MRLYILIMGALMAHSSAHAIKGNMEDRLEAQEAAKTCKPIPVKDRQKAYEANVKDCPAVQEKWIRDRCYAYGRRVWLEAGGCPAS